MNGFLNRNGNILAANTARKIIGGYVGVVFGNGYFLGVTARARNGACSFCSAGGGNNDSNGFAIYVGVLISDHFVGCNLVQAKLRFTGVIENLAELCLEDNGITKFDAACRISGQITACNGNAKSACKRGSCKAVFVYLVVKGQLHIVVFFAKLILYVIFNNLNGFLNGNDKVLAANTARKIIVRCVGVVDCVGSNLVQAKLRFTGVIENLAELCLEDNGITKFDAACRISGQITACNGNAKSACKRGSCKAVFVYLVVKGQLHIVVFFAKLILYVIFNNLNGLFNRSEKAFFANVANACITDLVFGRCGTFSLAARRAGFGGCTGCTYPSVFKDILFNLGRVITSGAGFISIPTDLGASGSLCIVIFDIVVKSCFFNVGGIFAAFALAGYVGIPTNLGTGGFFGIVGLFIVAECP